MRSFGAILALLCLTAGVPSASWADKADDTLIVAIQGEIRTLDHLYTTERDAIVLAELTDDGLFYVDPETLDYVPAAAASYAQTDDRTIDVAIRDGIRFHDGSPLSADDVVYTYDFILDKDTKTNRGRLIQSWLERIEKTGPLSVRFHLKHSYPLAIRDMASGVQIRKAGTYRLPDGTTDIDAAALRLNGIGPYRVALFEPGGRVVLERFDGYYADSPKGRPAIRRIVFRSIPDIGAQQAEIISGGVQWMYNVPTDIAVNIAATGYAQHVEGPSLRVGFIPLDAAGLTGKDNPFTNRDVRRAAIHAIDRKAIVKYLVGGEAEVIHAACHPLQFGCEQDLRKYAYDPAEARRLLATAGYPDGFEFDFWAYRERQVAEAVAADLAKVGIRARLRYVKLSTLDQARRKQRIPAYFGTWESGSTADTAAIAEIHWSLKSDRNFALDAQVASNMADAVKTIDVARRKALYSEALRKIADEAYWIPLYAFAQNYLISNDLIYPVPRDGLPRLFRARWAVAAQTAAASAPQQAER